MIKEKREFLSHSIVTNVVNDEAILLKALELHGEDPDPLFQRWKRNVALSSVSLMPGRRLHTVEELLRKGVIDSDQANLIFRKNPILHEEIGELVVEIESELQSEYGLETPGYAVRFDPALNPGLFDTGKGYADPFSKTITLLAKGEKRLPLIVAHELGHSYHMENSVIWSQLKDLRDSPLSRYEVKCNGASHVIEGWANFVALLHARKRDRQIGASLYEPMLREVCEDQEWIDTHRRTNYRGYYEGLQLFETIYERKGLDGAKYAAAQITSNADLRKFAAR